MNSNFQEKITGTEGDTCLSNETHTPMVSFGIPVRNANEPYLRQLLDSLLGQDLHDIEVVISDNASDDITTQQTCEEYAERDIRVKYHRNSENIGQNPNFNRVLELARGKYFRWIGSDDWLEPDYAQQCVKVLESEEGKHCVGVTTYYDFLLPNGERLYTEFNGERLESPLPHVRVRRHLWFMHNGGLGNLDIIYTMMRRDVLMKTRKIQFVPKMDQVLGLEVDLYGPFTHIPVCLAHRRRLPFEKISQTVLLKRYALDKKEKLEDPFGFQSSAAILATILNSSIGPWEKVLCLGPFLKFALIRIRKRSYIWLRDRARYVKYLLLPSPSYSPDPENRTE